MQAPIQNIYDSLNLIKDLINGDSEEFLDILAKQPDPKLNKRILRCFKRDLKNTGECIYCKFAEHDSLPFKYIMKKTLYCNICYHYTLKKYPETLDHIRNLKEFLEDKFSDIDLPGHIGESINLLSDYSQICIIRYTRCDKYYDKITVCPHQGYNDICSFEVFAENNNCDFCNKNYNLDCFCIESLFRHYDKKNLIALAAKTKHKYICYACSIALKNPELRLRDLLDFTFNIETDHSCNDICCNCCVLFLIKYLLSYNLPGCLIKLIFSYIY